MACFVAFYLWYDKRKHSLNICCCCVVNSANFLNDFCPSCIMIGLSCIGCPCEPYKNWNNISSVNYFFH